MPVRKHKLETSDREAFGDSHIVVRGPLAPRDSAALHRHRRERVLTLHGVESDSFEFLADWSELRGLRLHDCGVADWSALAGRARLEQVVIHTMRDRAVDFSFLSRLKGLRELSIGYVPHLTELPDLSRCLRLRRLRLFNLKRLADLSRVPRIRSLESFHLVATPRQPADLEAIMTMPRMKFMTAAFGGARKDTLFRELLARHGIEYGG